MRDIRFELLLPQEGSRLPPASTTPGAASGAETQGAGQPATGAPGTTEAPPTGSFVQPLMLFGVLFVFMWFFVIRPERRRQKERTAMLGAVGKGDRVVTSGGLHGQVARLGEKTFTLKVGENVRLEFDRTAIARIAGAKGEGSGNPEGSAASSNGGAGSSGKKSKPALAGGKK